MNVGYVRLSRDDDKKNYISIENQKLIIEQFVANRGMRIDRWYEDDGVSGYKFDRPGFSKLIEDLEQDIDTIVAKDLSRIGRHNAKVLLFLEQIKEQGKRLLLVDDEYDTLIDNDDIIGIKTWFNERYVKDTSKKIKRAIGACQKNGTLRVGVPFGYTRSSEDKTVIEIIDSEADTVKYIFDLYLKGFGYRKIAFLLTVEEVPTPSMVIRERYLGEGKIYKRAVTTKWSDNMVADILKNDFYIGNLRLHKRERTSINGVDHRVQREEQYVFQNNHTGIVDEEIYKLVQEIRRKRTKTNYRGQGRKVSNTNCCNMFGGCLFCKDCKSRLTPITRRRNSYRNYYICNTYNAKGKSYCKHSHQIEEQALMLDIIAYLTLCRNSLRKVIPTYSIDCHCKKTETVETRKQQINDSINNQKKQLERLFTQRVKDITMNMEFAEMIKNTYAILQEEIIMKLHRYELQLKELEERKEIKKETPSEILDRIIREQCLDRKDIEILIEKIVVDKDGMPEIELKYHCEMLYNITNNVENV